MENSVETIFGILAFLILIGMFLFPFLLFFGYVFYQNSKRKRIRERTRTTYAQVIGNSNVVPVRYASEARFRAWLKIFPWEGTGLLVPADGSCTFVGEKFNGTPLNLQFQPTDATVAWLGKCPWPNGAVSWFAFQTQSEKHYFTSETGPFVFGSNNSTKAAFDETHDSFGSANALRS